MTQRQLRISKECTIAWDFATFSHTAGEETNLPTPEGGTAPALASVTITSTNGKTRGGISMVFANPGVWDSGGADVTSNQNYNDTKDALKNLTAAWHARRMTDDICGGTALITDWRDAHVQVQLRFDLRRDEHGFLRAALQRLEKILSGLGIDRQALRRAKRGASERSYVCIDRKHDQWKEFGEWVTDNYLDGTLEPADRL